MKRVFTGMLAAIMVLVGLAAPAHGANAEKVKAYDVWGTGVCYYDTDTLLGGSLTDELTHNPLDLSFLLLNVIPDIGASLYNPYSMQIKDIQYCKGDGITYCLFTLVAKNRVGGDVTASYFAHSDGEKWSYRELDGVVTDPHVSAHRNTLLIAAATSGDLMNERLKEFYAIWTGEIYEAEARAISDSECAVGDCVTFGTYPSNEDGTESAPIEWIVLAREGQKALLISRYLLDVKPYDDDETREETTWEQCSLRKWLNGEFLNRAFSAEENEAILTTNVDNSTNSWYFDVPGATGGDDTQDRVFLLSGAETKKYFPKFYERGCRITPYANELSIQIFKQAKVYAETAYPDDLPKRSAERDKFLVDTSKGRGEYWLRSPGKESEWATRSAFGRATIIKTSGEFENRNAGGMAFVRPALWVDLGSF